MIEGIYVDQKGIEVVKELVNGRRTRVIFMPIFKSFADPIILFYINYFYNLELGYSFGSYEDTPKTRFFEGISKRIGHFLIKRKEQ